MRNATREITATLGALMGVAGIEHGFGEILQGSIAPPGIVFPSWPGSAFFRIVGGEPAMTIVPNLLVTGISAFIFSLAYLVWATLLVQRKNASLALILLSIAMLLVGGGIFPPIIGMIIGILGTRISSPLTWWRTHLSVGLRHFLAKIWSGSFFACLIAWLLLFPGINILGYFFGVNDPNLTVILILFAFGSLLLTILSGFAYDIQRQTDAFSGGIASSAR
jgi:hypothetical protein